MSDYMGYAGFPGLEAVLNPNRPSYTAAEAAAQITRTGQSWGGAGVTLTYSFASSQTTATTEYAFERMGATQIRSIEMALDAWSDVADVRFVRIGTGTSGEAAYSNAGQIRFEGYNRSYTGAAGWSDMPKPGGQITTALQVGSPWADSDAVLRSQFPWLPDGVNSTWAYSTALHEIGHGLGLSHPSDYGGPPFTSDKALYAQDTTNWSIMSQLGLQPGYGLGNHATPSTPGIHDIAAIQKLYGTNMATRAGDTVYGFNSNADEPYFRIANPAQGSVQFTVWDTGGNDTFDFSGYGFNHVIDLRPGALSSVSRLDPRIGNSLEGFNVGIAFGTTIENAVGGSGGEMIIGNDAANRIEGRDGHDFIYGGHGSDALLGEAGNDHIYGGDQADPAADAGDAIDGGDGSDYINGNAGSDEVSGGEGSDRIQGGQGDDVLSGNDGNDQINGNKGDDRVFGGAGNDVLQGGQGNDEVSGDDGDDVVQGNFGNDHLAGNLDIDVMIGGEGADVFVFARDDANIDFGGRRTDAILDLTGEDRIDLDWQVSRVVQGGSFGSLDEAANHARSMGDSYAVDAIKVGADTYLFWNVYGGHVEAVRVDGVDPSAIGVGLFI